ncbi:MAG: radical SAM protein, partial [Candidatus Micrarchaeia archaeon]
IVSNFSLLNDEKLNFLVTNNFGICTSLDGPKKVHDFNRRLSSGSSYDRVVKWIGVIKNELKYPLNALPTVTRHSLSFPREIVDEYVRLGFDVVRARGLNNAGVASGAWRQIGYSPEKFLEFWKSVSDYCFELNCKGKAKIREGIVSLIAEKITSEKSLAYACFGAPCGAALMQAAYDHEGNVYACDEARSFEEFKIGNFKKQSYSDVFASQTALNLVDLSSGLKGMCDACAWHPYCGPCMVCSYGSQGSVIPKLAVDHECKVRKGMVTYVFEKLVEGGADAEIMRRWITPKKE